MCRIALATGRADIAALGEELDAADYDTWAEYYRREPWDAGLFAAQICQAIDQATAVLVQAITRVPVDVPRRPVESYRLTYEHHRDASGQRGGAVERTG